MRWAKYIARPRTWRFGISATTAVSEEAENWPLNVTGAAGQDRSESGLCRHEQNACFMAAAYGRLTGEPGVVLVTSGPGVGNMLTGLLTATTEDDPVVAIGENVSRLMLHKASHQSAQNVKLMEAATKSFGAKGYLLDDSTKFEAIMRKALSDDGPVLVHMPVDYRDSMDLFINTDPNAGH
jgi:acetolactate synthase-1/2/3 large subunit